LLSGRLAAWIRTSSAPRSPTLGTPSPRKPSTLLREGTENLVAAMTERNVRRLVCVTLLGIGASRAQCSLSCRELILRVLAPMLADREAQEQAARGSDLDWVLVRPPRFTRGSPRRQCSSAA
jgi:hypothetical protein